MMTNCHIKISILMNDVPPQHQQALKAHVQNQSVYKNPTG